MRGKAFGADASVGGSVMVVVVVGGGVLFSTERYRLILLH